MCHPGSTRLSLLPHVEFGQTTIGKTHHTLYGPRKIQNLSKCDVSKQLRQFHTKLFERLSLITEDQLNKRNEKKYNNMVDNISQIITKEDFQLVIENEELKPKGKTRSFFSVFGFVHSQNFIS